MKKIPILFLAVILVVFISGFLLAPQNTDYNKQWTKVEYYVNRGLPRSAIQVVDSIYQSALSEGNHTQELKALIYRVSLQSRFREDHLLNAIGTFEKVLPSSTVPEKQILHSLLAELYQWYYQQNRWQINERGTVSGFEQKDIRTWDAVHFNIVIRDHYLASVKDRDALEKVNLENYSPILEHADSSGLTLWPTLYDMLANRVLMYYSTSDAGLAGIVPTQPFANPDLFLPAKEFVGLKPEGSDTTSPQNLVLGLYGHLLNLHIGRNDIPALVDLDLRRLQYVYAHFVPSATADTSYLNALTGLSDRYRDRPEFVKIAVRLAARYQAMGAKYNPLQGDEFRRDLNIAEKICKQAIQAFPDAGQVTECKNMIAEINRREYNLQVADAELSGKPFLSFLRFRNVKALYFRVIELNVADLLLHPSMGNNRDEVQKLLKQKPLKHWNQILPDTQDHQSHTTEIVVPELGNGRYMLFASSNPGFNDLQDIVYYPFWITGLSYLIKNDPQDGSPELFVNDRETGQPLSGILVKGYKKVYNHEKRGNEYQYFGEFSTNSEGFVKVGLTDKQKRGPLAFLLERGCDQLLTSGNNYFYRPSKDTTWRTKTYLFTDRAIYRPGQTVYFKGIVIDKNGNNVKIKQGFTAEVSFLNTNRKELEKIQLTTNGFGSFQGAFVIPTGELNGQMRIQTKTGSASFSVEEYKRPTFIVSFDTLAGKYKFGDTITVTGKAESYTGSSVMNAQVTYRVVRSVMPVPYYDIYRPWPYEKEIEVANGRITTADDGSFNIRFTARPAGRFAGRKNLPCRFTVYADVTDITGEVQPGTTTLAVGPQALLLTINSEPALNRENEKGIVIEAKNLSGALVDANISLSLFILSPPAQLLNKRYWPQPDINLLSREKFRELFPHAVYGNENKQKNRPRQSVYTGKAGFHGTTEVLQETLASSKPGEYLLTATALTGDGDTIKAEKYFTLYSTQTKQSAVNNIEWSTVTKKKAEPGEVVQLIVGSAAKKTKVYYEVVNGSDVPQSGWLTVSRKQKVIDVPVKEAYRGNFAIHVYSTRYNRFYHDSYLVEVPFSNKKLNITLETHRDYLTPGKKEEWKVKITGPQGEKLASELLAGMYDASLDIFRSNKWNFPLYQNKRNRQIWKSGYFRAGMSSRLYSRPMDYTTSNPVFYPGINWFGYEHYSGYPILTERAQMRMPLEGAKQLPARNEQELENKQEGNPAQQQPELSKTVEHKKVTIPLRTNFNETAFFYPQLETDSTGNVMFGFTTPDALTEWKLMMLAYSKDLKTGMLIKMIKARKQLMIIPNLPRFVRQGDDLAFSAKLVNSSGHLLTAKVSIEFYNAITLQKVDLFEKGDKADREVTLRSGNSGLMQWNIHIPDGIEMLAYRIKAVSPGFSDGEERMFPVLTNRMLVTETLPLYVNADQTKTFVFKKLTESETNAESSLKSYRFTVEFTSNPAWYAIQALPYLSETKNHNTGYLFQRYFANSLSAFIVNSNPKIKAVFESWKQLTPESFYSKLQKNEELKNLVLSATPWVTEAESESEQKRRIGILFDLNRLAGEKETILARLRKRQMPGGAWPWFPGMHEDRHTSQTIVLGIGKLQSKGVISLADDAGLKQMTRKAVSYLDGKIVEDYNKLKKNNPKGMDKYSPGSLQIEYLYARSLLIEDFPVGRNTLDAFNFYLSQEEKYWLKKSNFLQGMAALTLYRLGHRNTAEAIMRSLKERALHNNEMGMYWRGDQGWNWYQAPVETQALLLEAFQQVMNDTRSVEEMKKWLLKQKQTTQWKTGSATAEAVYSLLFTGGDLLAENNPVQLKVGNMKIIPGEKEGMKTEAGTGYFKTSWHGSEIKPAMGNITVTNPNNHIAWGGAYWQYFEDLDRITTAASPLSLEKQLFVRELTDNGPVTKPIEEGQVLKTGDKVIVRLIIRSDRNMDYVQLTDMRAAALEPVVQLSGYSYGGGLGFYKSVTDVSMQYFIRRLPKGTYVLEYPLMVTQQGEFSNGIATIQSFYAPEFAAHSGGVRLTVR